MIKLYLSFLLIAMSFQAIQGQNISTEGTDFWLGFMENDERNTVEIEIHISADDSVSGSVSIPGLNWSANYDVLPGTTTLVAVPLGLGMNTGSGVIQDKGIHVTADEKISVFALNKRRSSADAAVIFPTPSLGKEYYVMAYPKATSNPSSTSHYSECLIVGVEDNTQIEIIPSVSTNDGHSAKIAYSITLDQGQSYQLQSTDDLSGTRIKVANGNDLDCKNFAVFGGNEYSQVGGCGPGHDHLYEQMTPVNTWGRQFVTVPFESRSGGDIVKVVAAYDNTLVQVTGRPQFLLNAGEHREFTITETISINSNEPIQVAQFSRSQSCDNNNAADPFMIMISPNEQLLKKITFNALNVRVIERYYLNIVTITQNLNSLRLDGQQIGNQFVIVPSDPNYSYAQIPISNGNHTIESDTGFIAYVYGYGNFESFGYVTGAGLRNLNVEIFNQDQSLNVASSDTVCLGTEVAFNAKADTLFKVFNWDFGNATDTGKSVIHTFEAIGEYQIAVKASTGTGDCSSQETGQKNIQVVHPEANLIGSTSVCPDAQDIPYQVEGTDAALYEWGTNGGLWAFGSGAEDILVDWGNTNSNAFVSVRPRHRLGCWGDSTILPVKVNIKLEPAAPLGADTLCLSDTANQKYEAIFSPGNKYDWEITGGRILSTDQNKIEVSWFGNEEAKLWFTESSLSDTICSGVSDTLSVQILDLPNGNGVIKPVSCFGSSDGQISLTISGGLAPYEFTWGHGATTQVSDQLAAGTYNVTISDQFGCENHQAFEVTQPLAPLEALMSQVDVLCFGESTGSASVAVSGGTLPYRFVWDHPNGLGSDLDLVPIGTYTLDVFDGNNCKTQVSVTIDQPALLEGLAIAQDAFCPGESSGQVQAQVIGGVLPYQFNWIQIPTLDHEVANQLRKGTYNIKVTDANDCQIDLSGSVGESTPKVFVPKAFTPNGDGLNDRFAPTLSCSGQVDFKIFNRWGEIIHASNDTNPHWDGLLNDKWVPNGSYTYTMVYESTFEDETYTVQKFGTVLLMR